MMKTGLELLLWLSLLVGEVHGQGRLQVGGRPPKSVDLGVCSIR